MIDIHVLTYSGTRADWLAQCLASLEGQPCAAHIVIGVEGHVGAGRAKGFALGEHEFVAYVDSDDYLLPGALDACLLALDTHRAVTTCEYVEYLDGSRHPYPKPGHNISVYRREDIAPLLPLMALTPYTVDMQTRARLQPFQLEVIGYVWRIHEDGAHRCITPNLHKQESLLWQ